MNRDARDPAGTMRGVVALPHVEPGMERPSTVCRIANLAGWPRSDLQRRWRQFNTIAGSEASLKKEGGGGRPNQSSAVRGQDGANP